MLSFYYCQLIARQQQKYLQRLKRYLNLLVVPNPNLPINDDFDMATHNAILNYKKQLNRRRGQKTVVEDGTLTNTLWQIMWGELGRVTGSQFQIEEMKTFESEFLNFTRGSPYINNVEALQGCDAKLAKIFGEKNAVVATIYDPKELKKANGKPHHNAGNPRPFSHSAIPTNEQLNTNDRGGIMHIYPNEQGLPEDVGVFAPAEFTEIFQISDGTKIIKLLPKGDNQKYFFNNNKQNPLYIVYAHVKTAGVSGIGTKRTDGAIKIGNVGGPGGESEGAYVHCHIAFYSKFYGNSFTRHKS